MGQFTQLGLEASGYVMLNLLVIVFIYVWVYLFLFCLQI